MTLPFLETYAVCLVWALVLLTESPEHALYDRLGSYSYNRTNYLKDLSLYLTPCVILAGGALSLVSGDSLWIALLGPLAATLLVDALVVAAGLVWVGHTLPHTNLAGGWINDESYIKIFEDWDGIFGELAGFARFALVGAVLAIGAVLYAIAAGGLGGFPSALLNGDQAQGSALAANRIVFIASIGAMAVSLCLLAVGALCLRAKGLILRRRSRRRGKAG